MQVQQSFWMKVSFEIFPLGARVLLWKIEFHLLGVSSVVLPVWCGLNGGKNTKKTMKKKILLTYREWSWIYRQMKTDVGFRVSGDSSLSCCILKDPSVPCCMSGSFSCYCSLEKDAPPFRLWSNCWWYCCTRHKRKNNQQSSKMHWVLKFGLAKEDHWWWCLAARLVGQPAAMAAFKGLGCSGGCLGATSPVIMSASLPITPWCCRAGFLLLPLPSRPGSISRAVLLGRAAPSITSAGMAPGGCWSSGCLGTWLSAFTGAWEQKEMGSGVSSFTGFSLNQRRRWLPRKWSCCNG